MGGFIGLWSLIPSRAKLIGGLTFLAGLFLAAARIMLIAEGRRRAKVDGLKRTIKAVKRMQDENAKSRTGGTVNERLRRGDF